MNLLEAEKVLLGWVFVCLFAYANELPIWIIIILLVQILICIIAMITEYKKQNGTKQRKGRKKTTY